MTGHAKPTNAEPVLTVGHSTRTFEQLAGLIGENGVDHLVDVRSFPRSRRHPWFNADALSSELRTHRGIEYSYLRGLGGRRTPQHDSPNQGWHNFSFQGYADHMRTEEFREDLERLLELCGSGQRVCLMCSEAVPWRCHRRMISDALLIRGFPVEHILDERQQRTHTLTPWAEVVGRTELIYPPPRRVDAPSRPLRRHWRCSNR